MMIEPEKQRRAERAEARLRLADTFLQPLHPTRGLQSVDKFRVPQPRLNDLSRVGLHRLQPFIATNATLKGPS
jgi:hypothetical protein